MQTPTSNAPPNGTDEPKLKIYFLPNLLTAANLFCGFIALTKIVEANILGGDYQQIKLALGFILLHIVVLFFDSYMPYNLAQVLVPFLSPYRPLWVGIGVIGLYLSLLVTVTFYLRGRIGMQAFRSIHVLSLVAYLGVTLHGLLSGTDTSLISVLGLYAGTFLVVVFLLAYWVFQLVEKRSSPRPAAPRQTATRF